ncbi:MAG TPA: DUF4331 family protein [Gemmataceae bacterium]|nr:DUF4331 family protein [Gemmataceae bacterium]
MRVAPGRTSLRWRLLLGSSLAVILGGILILVSPAADHRDGPIFVNTQANGRRDINDVYVFKSPVTATNTVVAMTFSPFAGAVTPVTFDETAAIELKVDNDGDAIEELTFRVTFSPPDMNGVQEVTLRGLPAVNFPNDGILAKGTTNQNIPIAGGGMFRAGYFDDPFFFVSASIFTQFLNGTLAGGQFPNPGVNFFGPNVNTLGIVLEVPTASLLSAPNNPKFGVWGRVEVAGVQVDRMGRPGINTALIPPVPRNDPSRGDRRNAFNAGVPSNDVRDFFDDMVAILTNPNGPYQRTQADATGLASFLLPDILTYDSSQPDGFPNGRRLRDGVIDVELNLLTNGRVTSMNVFDDNGMRITDGTNGTSAAFPYFGAANNPPQGIINP